MNEIMRLHSTVTTVIASDTAAVTTTKTAGKAGTTAVSVWIIAGSAEF